MTTSNEVILTSKSDFCQINSYNAGYVASTCNPATGRRDEVDGLRLGQLLMSGACRSGVRTGPGIDMDRLEESDRSRLN